MIKKLIVNNQLWAHYEVETVNNQNILYLKVEAVVLPGDSSVNDAGVFENVCVNVIAIVEGRIFELVGYLNI